MKKSFIYTLPALALAMASCAHGYEGDFKMDKPESVELDEQIAAYDVLSEYSSKAGVTLGVAVDPAAFATQGLAYSIVKTNFGEVESAVSITPSALKNEENVYDFSPLENLVETADKAGVKVFGPALCTDANLPAFYLNSLLEDVVIPYEPWNEQILMYDFESDEIGKAYASQKKAAGSVDVKVMEDPLGLQGKVLGGTKLTMDVPLVEITLPEGSTLADVSRVTLKCLLLEGTPTSARIQIEASGLNDKSNPYSTKGKWQEFIFDMSNIKFKEAELKQNKIKLAVGAYGSGVSCCIDDITIRLEHPTGDDTVIVKTPEEKTEIVNGELYKWVDGITDICADTVKDYIIFDQPLESVNSKFVWSDYLGEKYVADVQKAVIAKAGADVKFYVSQNLTVSDAMAVEVAALKAEIQKLENSGVKVDGVNVVLSTSYSFDSADQAVVNANTVAALKSLASFGKPVRLSSLKVNVINENGGQANPANMSVEQRKAVGEYYNLIISTFLAELGNNAKTISFSAIQDTATDVAPWQQNGNRSFVYEGIVKGLSK
ncbi:MAG: hypothetical protein K2N25_07975 [Muribaculaceae bacterium]|nr:hypothetical protein [Muribaculaceae bacterium]